MRILSIAAAALVAAALPALAQTIEFPQRKAGQWNIEMTMADQPPMAIQMCLDAATDAQMMAAGLSMSKEMCPEMNMGRDGNTITIDSTCTMGSMTTKGRTVMSGDYQSSYTVDVTSEIEGGPAGMPKNSTMTQQATWAGACTGDLAPGDMLMPGGMKVNVTDMMKSMGGN